MHAELFHAQKLRGKHGCRGYDAQKNAVYRNPKNIEIYTFTYRSSSGRDSGDLEDFSEAVKCSKLDIDNPVTDHFGDVIRYRCKAVADPENQGFCPLAIPPPRERGRKAKEEYVETLKKINERKENK